MLTDTLDPDPSKWCKFQIVDQISFIIVSSVVVAKCLLFCLFMRSLTIRFYNKIKISDDEFFIFKVIGLWFSLAFLKSILNIVAYAIFQSNDQYHNAKPQIILSAVCNFIDKMSSFTLHSLLIKIPCLWIKNTVIRLDGSDLTLEQRKKANSVFKTLQILRIYRRVRLIIPIINLAFNIYFIIDPNFGRFSQYLTFLTIFEAFVAILTYTFGIVSLRKFRHLLDFPKQLKKRIAIEYCLLLLCCIARVFLNLLYYFHFALKTYTPSDNCFDKNERINYVSYIYLSFGYMTMHILPISTIILIYWPDIQKEEGSIASIISIVDKKLLKRKITLANNCCLLGSGQIQDIQKSYDTMQQSRESKQEFSVPVLNGK